MSDAHAVWLYARTHRGGSYLVGTLACCVALHVSLNSQAVLGSLDGRSSTPLVVAVGVLFGVLVGATWSSRAIGQDRHLTTSPSRVRVMHPWVLAASSSVLSLAVVSILHSDLPQGLVTMRSVLLWSGLSLTSATFFGSAYSWVVPVLGFVALANSGYDNGLPRWWNVPATPFDAASAWAVAGTVLLAASLLAFRWPARR